MGECPNPSPSKQTVRSLIANQLGRSVEWESAVEDANSADLAFASPPAGGNTPRLSWNRRRRSSNRSAGTAAMSLLYPIGTGGGAPGGGVNSLSRFASSWTRAAAFSGIDPAPRTFRLALEDDSDFEPEAEIGSPADSDRDDQIDHDRDGGADGDGGESTTGRGRVASSHVRRRGSDSGRSLLDPVTEERLQAVRQDAFVVRPSLSSSLGGSYGTMFSSSRPRRPSGLSHPANLFDRTSRRSSIALPIPDPIPTVGLDESEPLLIKRVEDGGIDYSAVVGQSTLPQTIFNSVNVMVGIGLLTLPLGFYYTGWLVGIVFFSVALLVTRKTALILAKCLDLDSSLISFADLAFVSFGTKARIATSLLFSFELVAAGVALVVLFGDSLDALVPGYGTIWWKTVCGAILVPLGFLPLRVLSFTSIVGILACLTVTIAILAAGLSKQETPGSLHDPAATSVWPAKWQSVFLGFGLLMSPLGGHSVFPNIYRDMRHPYKYRKAVNVTYIFTFFLDISMAVIGLLMFGDGVMDEITSSVLVTKGYHPAIGVTIAVCIAIIPLTKSPLNARPLLSTIEVLIGIHSSTDPATSGPRHHPAETNEKIVRTRKVYRAVLNVATTILFVLISILFPSFDRIMALLGSMCCFSVCVILPLLFHLKLFGSELSRRERLLSKVGILVASVLAILSTIAALLPPEMVGKPTG